MQLSNPNSIKEAYRYLANAKKTIGNSTIKYGRYSDSKYVKEGVGIAYLSAFKAIDVYLLSRGMSEKELPKSIEEYRKIIHKKMPHNGKLIAMINNVYENLHIFAYYRGGTEVQMVKSGLLNCKKIIEMIERSLVKSSSPDKYSGKMVNEPKVKYHKKGKTQNSNN